MNQTSARAGIPGRSSDCPEKLRRHRIAMCCFVCNPDGPRCRLASRTEVGYRYYNHRRNQCDSRQSVRC